MQAKYVITLVSDVFLNRERKNIVFNQLMTSELMPEIASIHCDVEKRHDLVSIWVRKSPDKVLDKLYRILDAMDEKYDCYFSNDFQRGVRMFQNLTREKKE